MMSVNSILSNKYVTKLQAEATQWNNWLLMVYETLDQWKECQRNWINLEKIFQSSELKKLPESSQFENAQGRLKKSLKLLKNKPVVKDFLKFNTKERTLEKEFRECNAAFDKIQKGIERYLEEKRNLFPRFYFITDETLLDILAN